MKFTANTDLKSLIESSAVFSLSLNYPYENKLRKKWITDNLKQYGIQCL